jgi:hypothetical protein
VISLIAALANPNNESPDSYNPPRRLPKEASGIVKDGLTEVSKGCLFHLLFFCCHLLVASNVHFLKLIACVIIFLYTSRQKINLLLAVCSNPNLFTKLKLKFECSTSIFFAKAGLS